MLIHAILVENLYGVEEKLTGRRSLMNWKYVKQTKRENIDKVETLLKVSIPENLRNLILDANNGRPEQDTFDTETEQGKQFKKLLSYNHEDNENIYSCISLFEGTGLIPFADDPAGNFLCLDKGKVIFWNHETSKKEFVSEDLNTFINNLYE